MFDELIRGIGAVISTAKQACEALAGALKDVASFFSPSKPAGSPVQPCAKDICNKCPGILTAQAADRADRKRATLTPAEAKTLDETLADAKSCEERAYILKAFAACHTPDECATFGKKIQGRDAAWMQDNLQMTGSSTGTGVQQQWSHSCNATTVQAVRGQMDPVYALQEHEDNPNWGQVDGLDALKDNPHLATEQRDMLTSEYAGTAFGKHSGVAVGRDQAGGGGRWADDLLNQHSGSTGYTYSPQTDPADPLTGIDDGLATGAPVPIVIGNGAGQYTHYVLVTGATAGPPRGFTIHDPWSGTTVQRSADDVTNGTLNIAGSNQVTAIENPTAVAREAAGKPPC